MPSTALVIARYNESLQWLYDLPKDRDLQVFVYNKGGDLDIETDKVPNLKVKRTINVGREGETYLRYLTLEYGSFKDTTIFTQGDPFEHAPNFMEKIVDLMDNGLSQPILPLTCRWKHNLPPHELWSPHKDTYYLEPVNRFTMCPLMFWDDGMKANYYNYRMAHPHLLAGDDVFHHFCQMIGLPDPEHGKDFYFSFFYAACFAVSNAALNKYSKDFYFDNHEICSSNPVYGFFFERVWWKMFGGQHKDPTVLQAMRQPCQ